MKNSQGFSDLDKILLQWLKLQTKYDQCYVIVALL